MITRPFMNTSERNVKKISCGEFKSIRRNLSKRKPTNGHLVHIKNATIQCMIQIISQRLVKKQRNAQTPCKWKQERKKEIHNHERGQTGPFILSSFLEFSLHAIPISNGRRRTTGLPSGTPCLTLLPSGLDSRRETDEIFLGDTVINTLEDLFHR